MKRKFSLVHSSSPSLIDINFEKRIAQNRNTSWVGVNLVSLWNSQVTIISAKEPTFSQASLSTFQTILLQTSTWNSWHVSWPIRVLKTANVPGDEYFKINLEKVKGHQLFTFFSTIKRRIRKFHPLTCSDCTEMFSKKTFCTFSVVVEKFLSSWLF